MKRYKDQETGKVIRWFEEKDVVGSLVEGDFPNERELRVSNIKGSIKARGLFSNISDERLIKKIKILSKDINRLN